MKVNGFICDRCGAHFDRNRIKEKQDNITRTIVGVAQIDVKRNVQRYDLCDDCLNQFRNWITNPKTFLCCDDCQAEKDDVATSEDDE